jgi:L-cysteine desulfidase
MTTARQISDLLCAELVEVTGCTEPASVAFAFLCARRHMSKPPDPMTIQAQLYASSEVLRNASTAIVPFLKRKGLRAVVAAGLSSRANRFDLFPAIERRAALILLKRRSWLTVSRVRRRGIYIKAVLSTPTESVTVTIQGRHNEIRSVVRNGRMVYRGATRRGESLTMPKILSLAAKRDPGLENTARSFITRQVRGDSSQPLPERIAALIRARMGGSSSPITTITGTGNQGIFLGVPFYELYRKRGKRILPAVLFSLLTQIYLTEKRGRISGRCGLATKAAPALAAGLAFADGSDLIGIRRIMSEVERRLQGMRCRGARPSCGGKGARAFRQVLKSLQDSQLINRRDAHVVRMHEICGGCCRGRWPFA